MTAKRPTKLKFVGTFKADGRPAAHLIEYGIPAQSLDETETAALSAEQIKIALNSGLYEDASPKEKGSKSSDGKSGESNESDNPVGNAPAE